MNKKHPRQYGDFFPGTVEERDAYCDRVLSSMTPAQIKTLAEMTHE